MSTSVHFHLDDGTLDEWLQKHEVRSDSGTEGRTDPTAQLDRIDEQSRPAAPVAKSAVIELPWRELD